MTKYIYIFIAIVLAAFIFSTCKTTEKTPVKEEPPNEEITLPVKDYQVLKTITYLPPPADSISEISINLVGDLMCHLPQTNNAKLSNGN